MAQKPEQRWSGIALAVGGMGLSGFLLWLSQRGNAIPMGTAYAVWTGIGAVGAFLVGVLFYADPFTFLRFASVLLIVFGLIGLKLSHRPDAPVNPPPPAAAAPPAG
jgi:quaternary ammonium compound-resistance protein SugE